MKKVDIFLSYAPHETLSLTDAMPHPLFQNIFYSYTASFFTIFLPFKDFVVIGSIPSQYFVPVDEKKDLPLGCIYEQETSIKLTAVTGSLPPYIISKFGIEIISAEEAADYKNLIPAIYFKNIFFHIDHGRIHIFIFIPKSEYAIRIEVDNELSRPNPKGINALIEASKSSTSRRYPPLVMKDTTSPEVQIKKKASA
ncbi:MAG: hypothetical protein R6V76_04505 [Desulfobacterales bacterium]